MGFPPRTDHPACAPNVQGEVGYQKVKLLIPGHIPGSFCEFRNCLSHRQRLRRRLAFVPLPAPVGPATALVLRAGLAGNLKICCDVAQVPHFRLAAFEAGRKPGKAARFEGRILRYPLAAPPDLRC